MTEATSRTHRHGCVGGRSRMDQQTPWTCVVWVATRPRHCSRG